MSKQDDKRRKAAQERNTALGQAAAKVNLNDKLDVSQGLTKQAADDIEAKLEKSVRQINSKYAINLGIMHLTADGSGARSDIPALDCGVLNAFE